MTPNPSKGTGDLLGVLDRHLKMASMMETFDASATAAPGVYISRVAGGEAGIVAKFHEALTPVNMLGVFFTLFLAAVVYDQCKIIKLSAGRSCVGAETRRNRPLSHEPQLMIPSIILVVKTASGWRCLEDSLCWAVL